jgi:hypothetical protein
LANGECAFATLPSDLLSPAFLGVRDEMHVQGTYQADFSSSFHEIAFQRPRRKSYFRAYVSAARVRRRSLAVLCESGDAADCTMFFLFSLAKRRFRRNFFRLLCDAKFHVKIFVLNTLHEKRLLSVE